MEEGDRDLRLVKWRYLSQGLSFIILGSMMEIVFLYGSALKGLMSEGMSPLQDAILFSLLQFFPIVFIELGLYYVRTSRKIRVARMETGSVIDNSLLTFRRVRDMLSEIKFLLMAIFVAILFILYAIPTIFNSDLVFSLRTAFTSGVFLSYLFLIRPIGIHLIQNRGKTRWDFLVSISFWLGIGLCVFGVLSLRYILLNGMDIVLLVVGILFLLVGMGAIHASFYQKYATYEFQGDNVILKCRTLGWKPIKITIPLNKITQCMKITGVEEQTLQESLFGVPLYSLRSIKGYYTDFMRGKRPYPPAFIYGTSYPKVYIKGTDFNFIISIKDADEFINEVYKRKANEERFY